ncbi:hypothetical protein KXV53_002495 [Aspergillus fumigatus]|nr:hypothetical protein KXV41_000189 [Aspergillus fumigatus]KAH2402286.1 hypothetical protein KXV53_002495 [Aspergillus fumigatus]KAH2484537.1 hypothetical protein KXV28_002699 [Aspergillus fumigatus]KAH3045698.1 hypothetical protein KXW83_004231 [Aspergillus fumigatus]
MKEGAEREISTRDLTGNIVPSTSACILQQPIPWGRSEVAALAEAGILDRLLRYKRAVATAARCPFVVRQSNHGSVVEVYIAVAADVDSMDLRNMAGLAEEGLEEEQAKRSRDEAGGRDCDDDERYNTYQEQLVEIHDPRAGILQSPNPCFQGHGRAKHVHQLSCALVLHWAIRARDSELVELMIHQKAPLNPAGEEREALSALGVAVVSRDETIIPRLLNAGARPGQNEEPCPIARAIETDQPRVVKLPLEHGIRLNSDTDELDLSMDGHAALFTAIMDGQYEMVEFLIEEGANPHLECKLWTHDYNGCSETLFYRSIGFAIHFRRLRILRLLLAKGVLPGQGDLCLAVKKEFEAVALLSKFSNQNLPQKESIESYLLWQQINRQDNGLDFEIPHKSWFVFDSTLPQEPEKTAGPSGLAYQFSASCGEL